MAELITLSTFSDSRGRLTVLEKCLPFEIKRVYWMHELNGENRGGHRHIKTAQAAFCLSGGCTFVVKNKHGEQSFTLDKPNVGLILEPEDWHELTKFLPNTIVMMVASEHYDQSDYVLTPISV